MIIIPFKLERVATSTYKTLGGEGSPQTQFSLSYYGMSLVPCSKNWITPGSICNLASYVICSACWKVQGGSCNTSLYCMQEGEVEGKGELEMGGEGKGAMTGSGCER